MASPAEEAEEPAPPKGWRLGFVAGVLSLPAVISAIGYGIMVYIAFTDNHLEAARTIGTPLRVTNASGDAVFFMTAQQEERVVGGASRWMAFRGFETVTHIDFWRFDPASAQPAWRKRLLTTHGANIFNYALWGADGDRIWVFMHEPRLLSAANGETLVDAATIEARNPQLKGVLPRQAGHYRFFDQYGLAFTAADARAWIIDAQSVAALPWPNKALTPRESIVAPALSGGPSITRFQKRGVLLPRDWLGVLTDDEAAKLNGPVQVPGTEPGERRGAMAAFLEYIRAPPDLVHDGAKRYRLWRANVERVSAAPAGWPKELPDKWGKRWRYGSFSVLEKSPEFLHAGLLSDRRSELPLYLTKPDSVLVLHRNRIDDAGLLHVTRIAGPDARVVWDAALPLSTLESVMAGSDRLLLFGRERGAVRAERIDADWLVSVDLATGATRTFNVSEAAFPARAD